MKIHVSEQCHVCGKNLPDYAYAWQAISHYNISTDTRKDTTPDRIVVRKFCKKCAKNKREVKA